MKRIISIILINDSQKAKTENISFGANGAERPVSDFLEFLVNEGMFTSIEVTRAYDVSKTVMKQLVNEE